MTQRTKSFKQVRSKRSRSQKGDGDSDSEERAPKRSRNNDRAARHAAREKHRESKANDTLVSSESSAQQENIPQQTLLKLGPDALTTPVHAPCPPCGSRNVPGFLSPVTPPTASSARAKTPELEATPPPSVGVGGQSTPDSEFARLIHSSSAGSSSSSSMDSVAFAHQLATASNTPVQLKGTPPPPMPLSAPERHHGGPPPGSRNLTAKDFVSLAGELGRALRECDQGEFSYDPRLIVVPPKELRRLAEHYHKSPTTIRRAVRLILASPDFTYVPKYKGRPRKLNAHQDLYLRILVADFNPVDAWEARDLLLTGLRLSDNPDLLIDDDFDIAVSTVQKRMRYLMCTYKLADHNPPKAISPETQASRREYCNLMKEFHRTDLFVFIDETVVVKRACKRAWAPKGKRPVRMTDSPRAVRINLVGAACAHLGSIGLHCVRGSVKKESFLEVFEKIVNRTIHLANEAFGADADKHRIHFIMDNSRVHGKNLLTTFINNHEHNRHLPHPLTDSDGNPIKYGQLRLNVCFLPVYSPFLNPIENIFGHLKYRLARIVTKNGTWDLMSIEKAPWGSMGRARYNIYAEYVCQAWKEVSTIDRLQASFKRMYDNLCNVSGAPIDVGKSGEELPQFVVAEMAKLRAACAEKRAKMKLHVAPDADESFAYLNGERVLPPQPDDLYSNTGKKTRKGEAGRGSYRCSVCKELGHNKRKCPVLKSRATSGTVPGTTTTSTTTSSAATAD